MYVSPSHPNPPKRPQPPDESGTRLATFPRGEGVELRLNLSTYNGHEFLSLRVFERDRDGGWWPCKGKGVSIRLAEAGPLGDLLADFASNGPPDPEPRRSPGRPAAPPAQRLAPTPEQPPTNRTSPPWEGPSAFDDDRPKYVEKNRRPQARNDHDQPPVSASARPFDELT